MIHIALVGNPNSGKSSLFNALTGLKQKVGNFPGVTVDKKTGTSQISDHLSANIIDLPGTYSLYPKRSDEWVTYEVLMNPDPGTRPEMVVLIADASNLKRNLLFCSQIIDLKIPLVIGLSMMDIARKKGIEIDIPGLERDLGVPVIPINPRREKGLDKLRKAIDQTARHLYRAPSRDFISNLELAPAAVTYVKKDLPLISDYTAIHYLINHAHIPISQKMKSSIEGYKADQPFNATKIQAEEIMQRYARIKQVMSNNIVEKDPLQKALFTEHLDKILLHRRWGYVILVFVLFLLFQSIFWIAQYPMDAIEWAFAQATGWLGGILPTAWWSDLFLNGILAGLSGIMVFVPQIMILFGLITLLEDTGYMARISFLTDKLMRKVGMNGKSVMPLISGFACAVPAIMSTRNIENRKERLLTILVTPLMSCSARLPVYTILIALVIPSHYYFGFLSVQGLVMMGLYLLGVVFALLVSYILKRVINIRERSFFILELPVYRAPRWKNMTITMWEKARIFLRDAGQVIMVISLILWFLSSFGPGNGMHRVREKYAAMAQVDDRAEKSELLGASYAGRLGKTIEPLIKPIGFDWKIGIALITSLAAREVFVGTMATLYSVGEDHAGDQLTLREKMAQAKKEDGSRVYTLGTGVSLMIFYVFAMQCMSTLAVVKRETRSWKWPMFQLVYMTGLAWVMSFIAYHLLR
jgi:ferrous iron transport protein B